MQRLLLRQFLSYIPNRVGQWLAREGRPYPKRGQTLKGTLVFADVSGFTAMSERLAAHGKEGAEILTQILNAYFARMLDDLVLPAGGDLFKFGGDAMTLFFPASGGKDGLDKSARRAVATALKMQEVMLEFAAYPTAYGEFNLKMSIGAHTGEVFGASLGSADIAQEYVLAGAGVESCAQAETAAEATQVFVTEETLPYLGEVKAGERRDGAVEILALGGGKSRRRSSRDLADKTPRELLPETLREARTYLPAGIPEKIEANPESPRIDSEHRDITVMFLNFWGIDYNRRAEAYGKLRTFYSRMQEITDGYGGVVNKMDMYVHGDKLMVLFGTPVAHEDDPVRAVQCALDMLVANRDLDLDIGMKIGINTGGVFSGNVGALGRKEFTVMGDAVNLSARLMSAAGDGEIYVSPTTLPHLGQRFLSETLEPIFVKGKAKPIPPTRIDGRSQGGDYTLAEIPFGREELVENLQARLDGGEPVLLAGQEGSGRAACAHYLAGMAQIYGSRVARGEAFAYTRGTPYAPLAQLFQQLLAGRHEGELKAWSAAKEIQPWTALLNPFLGTAFPESPECRSLEGDTRIQKTIEVLAGLLHHWQQSEPLFVLLENLHHLDEASKSVLEYLLKRTSGGRTQWMLTTEEDADLDWLGTIGVCTLPPYSREQVKTFAGDLLQVERIPDQLLDTLMDKAGGNPAFTREILKHLAGSDLIKTRSDHRYVDLEVLRQAEALLPGSLHASQLAKVDTLSEPAKQVLRTAAIIGERFRLPVLEAVADQELSKAINEKRTSALEEAEANELLLPEVDGGQAFLRFANASLRESIYESAAYAVRRQTHRTTGEQLERLYGTEQPENLPALSYHFASGEVAEKGFFYALRAGRWAKSQFANQEALSYFDRAQELAESAQAGPADLAQLGLDQGTLLALTGENQKAQQQFEALQGLPSCPPELKEQSVVELMQLLYRTGQFTEAEALNESLSQNPLSSPTHRARIKGYIGWVFHRQGNRQAAEKYTEEAIQIAKGGGDQALLGYLTGGLGMMRLSGANPQQAIGLFEQAIDASEKAKNAFYKTFWENNLGFSLVQLSEPSTAEPILKSALKTRKEMGHWAGVWETLGNLGALYLGLGNLPEAAQQFEEALGICRDIGDKGGEGNILINLGLVYGDQGQIGPAVNAFEDAHNLYTKAQAASMLPLCSLNLADLLSGVFAHDQAEFHYDQGLEQSRELGNETFICEFLRGRGANAPALGAGLPAGDWLRESLEIAERHGNAESAFLARVELAALPGDHDEDWSELLNAGTESFSPFAVMTFALKAGRHLLDTGREEEARALLVKAQELAEKTGILRMKWRLEALLVEAADIEKEAEAWREQALSGARDMAATITDADLRATFTDGVRRVYGLEL